MQQKILLNLEWYQELQSFPYFQRRYLRGVFLATILEPTDRKRQKRVQAAVLFGLAIKILRDRNSTPALLQVGERFTEYCVKHSRSSLGAGSEIAYRKKLTTEWREPASRKEKPTKTGARPFPNSSLESSARRQNHLMEVKTVAALVDIMKSGRASGNRGQATMEAAREFVLNSSASAKIGGTYTNEFGIKEAWKRKGSVAHLCGALVDILRESSEQDLTSHNYTLWADEMNNFLTRAFEHQEYLSRSENFAPQSRIPIKLQQLPEELKVSIGTYEVG